MNISVKALIILTTALLVSSCASAIESPEPSQSEASKTPVAQKEKAKPLSTTAQQSEIQKPNLQLNGIILEKGRLPIANISNLSTNQGGWFKENDEIGEWVIVNIGENSVTFTKKDELFTLPLWHDQNGNNDTLIKIWGDCCSSRQPNWTERMSQILNNEAITTTDVIAGLSFAFQVNADNSPLTPTDMFVAGRYRIYCCFPNRDKLKGITTIIARWTNQTTAEVIALKPYELDPVAPYNFIWVEKKSEEWEKGGYQVEVFRMDTLDKIAIGTYKITDSEGQKWLDKSIVASGSKEWFDKGFALLVREHSYNEAIKAFNKAIELDPQFAAAYYGRGVAKYKLDDYKDAKDDLLKAVELNPSLRPGIEWMITEINAKLAEQEKQGGQK